ncbi:Iron-regulated protein FrpC [Frankliniella fusca]|uniref:Iron-regulated protein FrpC n=1 Tax=Frankliniella fusca TaxID=407009 RepID=A0AAE1GSK7_9NEOP|nr:Iron-regulated protein FrpC [Frankliniella fusca]
MAALRAIVLLLAVSAVCAGKTSGSVRATSVQRAVNDATRHIESQIADIENYGDISGAIEDGLEKLRELVEKIKEKVESAESALLEAIKKAAEEVAERLNDLIEKATGLDLDLEDKLEDFEDKTEKCAADLTAKLRSTLLAIRDDAQTCAAPQLAEAKKIAQQIRELIVLLDSVPAKTIENIKRCANGEPIPSPEPETTSLEPETTPLEPETTTAQDDASSTAPETAMAKRGAIILYNRRRSARGISDIFEKVKCVTDVLGQAAVELQDAPKIVYYLDKEIRDLTSKDTQKTLKKCALQAVAGKGKELQKSVAELAYCIIAPSDDE